MTYLDQLTAEQLLVSIWQALRRIETNLALPPAPLELPTPEVHVAAPDLADIVTAVTSLRPGPTAEEIARAIAAVLRPSTDPGGSTEGAVALEAVARALERLDFRLQGMGTQAYGGGAVALAAGQTVAVTGALTNTELRASAVVVRDDYQTGEVLADQSGAGAVLTFTFASTVQMVIVHSVGTNLVSRADPFGGTPSAVLGVRCDDGVPVYIPVVTSAVKVFAPSGTTVTCYGLRRQ